MIIGNREYSRKHIERYIGNIHQLGGTFQYEFDSGSSKGVRAIEFRTGGGLSFTVLPDRGLDIAYCTYRGINLVYITPNGIVAPSFYHPQGSEWLRTFFAGLLTTCGLTYFGEPGLDGRDELGLHGRYTTTPAEQVCDLSRWEKDSYILEVTGFVEESTLFGDKMRLSRRISTELGKKHLRIIDTVENFGARPSPFTILYHINAGFPLLNESSELIITSKHIEPYDKISEDNISSHREFIAPESGFTEQNFLHSVTQDKDGMALAALINSNLAGGLGLYLKFSARTLPYLSEWKMMGHKDYVLGIEPCNTIIKNRADLRKEGRLPFLEPGNTRTMEVEIGVLDGEKEIQEFKTTVNGVLQREVSGDE